MSISNPNKSPSPVTRYFEWSGSEGKPKYYDHDTKQRVLVELPFEFMVLDTLATATGFSEKEKCRLIATEVRNSRKTQMVVRYGKNRSIAAQGLYQDINLKGLRFATSVYLAYKDEEELKIGNFKVSGAALTSWIDFCKDVKKTHNIRVGQDPCIIEITGSVQKTKGATKYYAPTFVLGTLSEESKTKAIELDKLVQEYLSAGPKPEPSHEANDDGNEIIYADELPEPKYPEPHMAPKADETRVDDSNDLPF